MSKVKSRKSVSLPLNHLKSFAIFHNGRAFLLSIIDVIMTEILGREEIAPLFQSYFPEEVDMVLELKVTS